MSNTSDNDRAEQVNPYSAPRSTTRWGASRILTLVIVGMVVAMFACAAVFACWVFFGGFYRGSPPQR